MAGTRYLQPDPFLNNALSIPHRLTFIRWQMRTAQSANENYLYDIHSGIRQFVSIHSLSPICKFTQPSLWYSPDVDVIEAPPPLTSGEQRLVACQTEQSKSSPMSNAYDEAVCGERRYCSFVGVVAIVGGGSPKIPKPTSFNGLSKLHDG